MTIVEITSAAFPVFERFADSALLVVEICWLPKARVAGVSTAMGVGGGGGVDVPVPLRFTTCGLPCALSVKVSVPVIAPATDGVNVTFDVQFAPAARLVPQLSDSPKLALGTMLVMVIVALPVFVTVMGNDALVVPIN